MNVLLVAPKSDLAYVDSEIQAVANALRPRTMLLGKNATSAALMEALKEPYDLIWFAGHGSGQGIEMADGLLRRESLTQFLRDIDRGGTAIFLNSCASLGLAMDIHEDLGAPIICTVVDVEDRDAYHTGALLARYLGQGHTLREAYNLARPGNNRQFLYLNGDISGRTDRLDDLMIAIKKSSHALYRRIDEIERQFDERITGIEDDIGKRFDNLSSDLTSNYQLRLHRGNSLRWGLGFLIFVMCMWLFYSDVRRALDISAMAAGIISMVAFPISGYLFMTGMGFSFDVRKRKDGEQ